MAIVSSSDVKLRLASATGPGNSTAAGAAGSSLGQFMSTTDFGSSNLFGDISGADNASSKADYQVLFIYNTVASVDNATGMQNVTVWINAEVEGGADVTIWADSTGAVAYNSSSAQTVASPADRYTAPTGSGATNEDQGSFVSANTAGTGLSLGTIGPQECHAVWIRRKANDTEATNNDGFTIEVDWDTSA